MTDAFSRRGFTRAAVFGAAALWLPELARADATVRARLEAVATPDGVRASLFVTSDAAMTVSARGVVLAGRLRLGERRVTSLELTVDMRRARMSRAGPRIASRVVLTKDREALLDTFFGAWPSGVSAAAARGRALAVRVTGADATRRAALGPLRGVRASARLT